jgi:hypothetical protein
MARAQRFSHSADMRVFRLLLSDASQEAASCWVIVSSADRARELAMRMLTRTPGATSIDVLEGGARLCTVSAATEPS